MRSDRRTLVSAVWILLGIGLNVACYIARIDDYWGGMGIAFLFIGVLQLFRWGKYKRDAQYREKVDVESKDERNRFIAAQAWAWAGYLFVLICAVASIVLRILGQNLLSIAAGGAVLLEIALYWISYAVLRRKY